MQGREALRKQASFTALGLDLPHPFYFRHGSRPEIFRALEASSFSDSTTLFCLYIYGINGQKHMLQTPPISLTLCGIPQGTRPLVNARQFEICVDPNGSRCGVIQVLRKVYRGATVGILYLHVRSASTRF